MSKALTITATYLSNSKKNMSRILSATSTEPAAKLHRALATESEAETLSCSFQSSSSPTMPGASEWLTYKGLNKLCSIFEGLSEK